MGKRKFTIDLGNEKIEVEGHQHKNVAIKYLMKRRRSLIMTKDKDKVEKLSLWRLQARPPAFEAARFAPVTLDAALALGDEYRRRLP